MKKDILNLDHLTEENLNWLINWLNENPDLCPEKTASLLQFSASESLKKL
jgi:hypothetical protein